jgi:hypothetical protein
MKTIISFICALCLGFIGFLSVVALQTGIAKGDSIVDTDTSAVSSIYTEKIMSMHDVFKPQHIPELMSRYGEQYMPMFQFFRSMGREYPVAADEWYGHEENWYHRTITVKNLVNAGANGATVNITLAVADHDSDGNSYPRVNDIVTIPGTWVQAQITVKNVANPAAHVLTLKPLLTTQNIPELAANTVLAITNGAHGAGTGQPAGTVVGTTKRTFGAQIVKETIGAQGSQLVTERWYTILDDNRSVKGYYSPGYSRGDYLMALKMDGAFTWGVNADNITETASDGSTVKVKTTRGVFPWVTALGKTFEYGAGNMSIDDLDAVGLYLKSQGVTSGIVLMLAGAKLLNDIDKAGKDYIDHTGADLTKVENTLWKGNREISISLNIKTITKGGITFMFKPMDVWSNPVSFGASGYNLDQYGLIIPMAKVKDPVDKVMLDNIACRYRAKDAYSRRFETWRVAGAGGGNYVTDVDAERTYFRAHVGLQMLKVNQMGMFVPEA